MAKKLNVNIETFIDFKWLFLDLVQQLDNEIYRKDNYHAFNDILEWFMKDMEVKVTGFYYPNVNSVDFKLVNEKEARVYDVYYDGEDKMFTQMIISDTNGVRLKDLELGNLVGIRL